MTRSQLFAIMPYASEKNLDRFLEPLNQAMAEFGIDTPQRQAAFLAQIAHESGSLRYVEEIASGAAYDDRDDLGNTNPAAIIIAKEHGSTPGRFWKGHGLIQVTGYHNHAACGAALGLDLINFPTLLCEPVNAARSAAWFWQRNNLNKWADCGDFDGVCDVVNRGHKTQREGDANGYADRVAAHERAKEVLT